jgi:hypothetical protein
MADTGDDTMGSDDEKSEDDLAEFMEKLDTTCEELRQVVHDGNQLLYNKDKALEEP